MVALCVHLYRKKKKNVVAFPIKTLHLTMFSQACYPLLHEAYGPLPCITFFSWLRREHLQTSSTQGHVMALRRKRAWVGLDGIVAEAHRPIISGFSSSQRGKKKKETLELPPSTRGKVVLFTTPLFPPPPPPPPPSPPTCDIFPPLSVPAPEPPTP